LCARAPNESPELRLSARDLAAVYLGGVSFHALAAAGRIDEDQAGALRTADLMFGVQPAPWCPVFF